MLKFNKDFNAKIVSVVIVVLFLFNSSAYGIDLSRNTLPDKLRVPVGEPDVYNRITKAIETWEENEKDIDPNIKSAHKEKRANLLHQTEKGAKAIEVTHSFLEANNFTKEEIDLFVKLQEKAAIEVPDWGLDKGGLWLVAPKPEEALPNEHASDRGGIHIVAYPDVDIACAYVHGMAAYVGLSHEQAEALEKAFAEWRNEKKPIPEKLKAEFHEGIGKRKDNPFLLTELSKQEKGEGKSQRDYTSFLSNQKKDPHGTYKRLLKTILGEAEAVYMQFLVDNSVPDAKDMARNFAEDALASIIRRETESNFVIPYLPEDFPTLLQLIDNIAEESSLEQEMALNQYVRQIIGALLFLEIPTYLRNQWSQSAAASQKFPLLGDGATAMLNLQGLTKEQHDLLNQALGVFFTGFNQVREDVHILKDTELNNIDPNSDLRNIPNLRAYRFTKEQLMQALEKIEASEEEIDYIIKNLISHPGRFRDGQGTPRATNLFILDEHYALLSQLDDRLKAQWARHEAEHLENIELSEAEVQERYPLGEVVVALKRKIGQNQTSLGDAEFKKPIREDGDDFFGVERERYLRDVTAGTLPKILEERANAYPWPVDMANPKAHIVGLYGEDNLIRAGIKDERHLAIDIQTEPGTAVRTIEDGFVVFVQQFPDESRAANFVDVWVYSPASKLLWLYLHLDKNGIPPYILRHHHFNPEEKDENFKVQAGSVIGTVSKWHNDRALENVDIPESVKATYGVTYNHVHIETYYVNKPYAVAQVDRLTSVNPLQLFRPLYALEFTERQKRQAL